MKLAIIIFGILLVLVGYKGLSAVLKEFRSVWVTTVGKVLEYNFEPNRPGMDQYFKRLTILYQYEVEGVVFKSDRVRSDPNHNVVPPDIFNLLGYDAQAKTIRVQYLQSDPAQSRIYYEEPLSIYVGAAFSLLLLLAGGGMLFWAIFVANFAHTLNQGTP